MTPAGRIGWVLTLVLTFLCSGANATMVQLMNLDDMLLESDLIVEANVETVESRWTDDGSLIYTYVTLNDPLLIYGQSPGGSLTLRFEGGEIAGHKIVTSGIPSFVAGDRELLMLRDPGSGVSPVVGIFQGRFRIIAGEVTDYGGRPVVGVEDNVLVKLGDNAPEAASSNSSGISQGVSDGIDYGFKPGIDDTPSTGTPPGVLAPVSADVSQEPELGGVNDAQPPPAEVAMPGVSGMPASPDKKYSRYTDPTEDVGARLTSREFADYIRQRLRELGK